MQIGLLIRTLIQYTATLAQKQAPQHITDVLALQFQDPIAQFLHSATVHTAHIKQIKPGVHAHSHTYTIPCCDRLRGLQMLIQIS